MFPGHKTTYCLATCLLKLTHFIVFTLCEVYGGLPLLATRVTTTWLLFKESVTGEPSECVSVMHSCLYPFQTPSGPRGAASESAGVPESPRLELMEQDSKDSAQSSSTISSVEVQQEYSVSQGWANFLTGGDSVGSKIYHRGPEQE